MKYEVKFTSQFKKDLKLAKKQNKDLDKLFEVVNILADGGTLDAKYRDHDLSGDYKGTRECHIVPDWLSGIFDARGAFAPLEHFIAPARKLQSRAP